MSLATRARKGIGLTAEVLTGRRHIYYGWWLLAGSVFAMALGNGVSFWALTLYVEPLEEEFGWSRAHVTGGISAAVAAAGLSSPLVGRWIDTRGPRSAVIIGTALTAASYVLLATTSALWQWYLYSIVNAVFRQLMFFFPFQALISRFFDRRRGLALAVLSSGFSLGGLVVVPIMAYAISHVGWDGSFIIAGAAILVTFMPIAFFLIKNSPADIGEFPDGAPPTEKTGAVHSLEGVTLSQAMRTPNFWLLAAAMTLFVYGLFGWLVHQVPFYESIGLSTSTASLLVAIYAGSGVIIRLSFGFIVDRLPKMELVTLGLATFLTAAMTTLFISSDPIAIGLFLTFFVLGAGGGPMIEPLLLTRAFGVAHFATIFGVFFLVETIGQVISPVLAGWIFDSQGSYDLVLLMWMSTFAASGVLLFIAARLPRPALN